MKLNKKVLIIFLVFIVLFLIFTNKGYCASGDLEKLKTSYSINDVVFDISPYIEKLSYYDNYDYHVIWYDSYNSQHNFWIVSTSVPNVSFYSNNLWHVKPSNSKGRKRYTILTFKSNDGSFVRSSTFDEQSSEGSFTLDSTLYSSHDILDSNGNVVFQVPVAVDNPYNLQPILEKTKVGEMATKEMSQALLVVMKKVAVVIVGLVALLTGWLLLLKLLRRS